MPGQFTAVLYHKPHTSIFTPNVYSELHKGDEWLVFPWENSKAPAKQDYLQSDEFLEFAALQDAVGNDTAALDSLDVPHYVAGMTNDKKKSFLKFLNKTKNG